MHTPETKADLICELQNFLHSRHMNDEEQAFFEANIQAQIDYLLSLLDEPEMQKLFGTLHNFLVAAAVLHRMEGFENLVPRIMAGARHMHQMRHFDQMVDTSEKVAMYGAFLEAQKGVEDFNEIITQDVVFEFMRETPNKYLLITLLLSALQEGFDEAYQDYVKGKVCLYTFTLAFWSPMESLFESECPIHQVMWMDMLSDSVGPKMSSARFAEMVKAAG